MTSGSSFSLILRRLNEIECKLDRILEELRTPTAIGYSVRRGNLPRKDGFCIFDAQATSLQRDKAPNHIDGS